jgi:hypothetical protein
VNFGAVLHHVNALGEPGLADVALVPGLDLESRFMKPFRPDIAADKNTSEQFLSFYLITALLGF